MADPSGRHDAFSRRTFLRAAGLGAAALTLAGSAPLAGADGGGRGYPSVAAMLSSAPFYVAHRGCSLSWPEMSLYAYTRAARAGFGALEVSLARTRDGVWFGLHDETLDRTSGVTGATASSLTWEQVASLRIAGSTATDDPTQPSRPYLRWEELVAAFYPSHVLFVDPKSALDHIPELMRMMNALPGTPQEHLVCKYYGVSGDRRNTAGWARLAADSGYHRWGYFYGADVPDLAAYQDRWDLLGMDLKADDAAWAAVDAYAKPVIGHLAATPRDIATGWARGTDGIVVASARALTRAELTAHRSPA